MKKYIVTISLVVSFFFLSTANSYAADFQVTNLTDPSCSAATYEGPYNPVTCSELGFLPPSITRWMFNFDTVPYSDLQTMLGPNSNAQIDLFRASDDHVMTSLNTPFGDCQDEANLYCMAINGDGWAGGHWLVYGPSTYGNNPQYTNIPDGSYYVGVWDYNNPSKLYKSNVFTFPLTNSDLTPPTITISSPAGTVSTQTVPVTVSITDASGVASHTYSVDGNTVSNTSSSLDLTYYQPGSHTFTVSATDTKGNHATNSSTFVYAPSTAALIGELNTMYADGSITNLGNSLYTKINQAQSAIAAGNYSQARSSMQALINHIQAQINKHISAAAGNILIAQIQYLLTSLPQ